MTKAAGSIVVPALLLLFLIQVTAAAAGKSATYDESVHIYSGWRILTAGDFRMNHEHPPLMKMLAALPLTFMDLTPPPTTVRREVDQWQASHEFVFHVNDADAILPAARLPIGLLATLMAYVLYRVASAWIGRSAGIVALALLVFEPNILAHSGLVTTDLGITAMVLFTLGAWYRHLQTGSRAWLLATGGLCGLALLTKFTAVLLAPILILSGAAILYLGSRATWRSLLVSLLAVAGVAVFTLNLGYGFDGTFSSLRSFEPESRRFEELSRGGLGGLPLPIPREYVRGFDHAEAGGQEWWAYLFGRHSKTGWRHYYLAALAVKTPLPLLLLAVTGLVAWPWILRDKGERQAPLGAILPQIPILVWLFAFTFSTNLKNIGLRYVLPVYPFLCVLGGMATRVPWKRSRWLMGLVVWQALIAFWIYPDYLAFFNLTVGGPSRGAEVLLDSNLDWGQDLRQLGEYIREKKIERIYVDYFGRSCLRHYGVSSTPDFEGGWIAVSATNLKGVYANDKDRYAFLEGVKPEAILGRTIHVYNVPRPVGWRPKGSGAGD